MTTRLSFQSMERIPEAELLLRQRRCRDIMAELYPDISGIMVFSRVNLYYLSGSLANGLLWLPQSGRPVLLCRRGLERSRLDSAMECILPFRSYSDVPQLLEKAGSPLGRLVGVESNGLPWSMGLLLSKKLSAFEMRPAENVLSLCRAVKTDWELERIRKTGRLHNLCVTRYLPERISPGMNEHQIASICMEIFLEQGHCGINRTSGPGVEMVMGHIAAGDSGNYPSYFDGPLGLRGEHPAAPYMGSPDKIWEKNEVLAVDTGLCLYGYNTDKTQIYWSGAERSIPARAREAHELCISIQNNAVKACKPGVEAADLYSDALKEAENAGFSDGFMGLGENKTAFLGHGIGLQVDEYPPLAKGERKIQKGMVLAFEPKIGLPDIGMVGVENTFEVAQDGCRPLTGTDYCILCLE